MQCPGLNEGVQGKRGEVSQSPQAEAIDYVKELVGLRQAGLHINEIKKPSLFVQQSGLLRQVLFAFAVG